MSNKRNISIVEKGGKPYIFDFLRKKYVVATPEEEVRQQLLAHLVDELLYPKGLISVETGLTYNKLAKRTDIVVYGNDGTPYMLLECKRNDIRLGKEAIYQLASYNRQLNARLLVLTNGKELICLQVDTELNKLVPLDQIPHYRKSE